MRFVRLPGLVILALSLACSGGEEGAERGDDPAPEPSRSRADGGRDAATFPFRDVTAASGVLFRHRNGATGRRHFPETMGPGLALFDADGDGDLDLYLVDGGALTDSAGAEAAPNRLWRNRGDGTFEEATDTSGLGDTGYGMGCTVGDYDGDGRPDLYVLNFGRNALYRNLGQGRFAPVTVGVEDPGWSVGGAFLDYDGDGDLDLYVVNYLVYDPTTAPPCTAGPLPIYCSPESFPPAPDRLYRNDGSRFVEVSSAAGISPAGKGMGVAVGDYDGDGDPDLFVANDRTPNHLYRNDGGRFVEVGTEAGVAYSDSGNAEGGMGAVFADLTGEGRTALFFTNFQKEPNRLLLATGGGFFDDLTLPSGLGYPSLERVSWGIAAIDVEGDGDLDLAVSNGHVYDNAAEFIAGSSYGMADQLFLNDDGGRFSELPFPGPAASSRGLAAGDLDGDGDPDLVIASCGGGTGIWRNEWGRSENYLLLALVGRGRNSSAYGARVSARIGDRTVVRAVDGGGGYASHSDTRVYLGLEGAAGVDGLEVRWPGGVVERAGPLAGGQELRWLEGEGIAGRRELGSAWEGAERGGE